MARKLDHGQSGMGARAQRYLRRIRRREWSADCPYDPDNGVDTATGSLLPAADCYAPGNFNDRVALIAITNYVRKCGS